MLSLIMFDKYDKEIKDTLKNNSDESNWEKILSYHQLMIRRIQHERLIHLIVTVFVGVCLILSLFTSVMILNIYLGVLAIILLILFTAYIFHYRYLENMTQSWYVLEDKIIKHED